MHSCKLKTKDCVVRAGDLLNDNDIVLISAEGMITGTPLYFYCSRVSDNGSDTIPSIINAVRDTVRSTRMKLYFKTRVSLFCRMRVYSQNRIKFSIMKN
jgi:hypothetical protein